METLLSLVNKNGKVQGSIVGQDGNAFFLISYTSSLLRGSRKWSRDDVSTFQKVATSGDYNNVILSCMTVLDMEEEEC